MKESEFQHDKYSEPVMGLLVISSVIPEKAVARGYGDTKNNRGEEVK